MTSRTVRRLLWIALAVAAVVAVAALAYGVGANAGHGGSYGVHRGFGMMGYDDGAWWGFLPALLVVGGIVVLLVLLLAGPAALPAQPPNSGSVPPATGGDIDRLRELAQLHDEGKLTDEEFAAAKRKLLGLP